MRFIKKTILLAKVETTPGTDAVPTGAANAVQIINATITPIEAKMVNLNVFTPYFGGSIDLVATTYSKISFDVLVGGAGAAATAPPWGQLLLGCGMAETTGLTAPARVEYTPITDLMKTLTLYYYDDGILHKILGSVGTCKLSAKSGDAPKFTFEFLGADGIPAAATNAVGVYTAWKIPPTITKANVTDIQLGCAYAAGALTGGTPYNSSGLTLDWANTTAFSALLTVEQGVLGDRNIKGTTELDLTAAQEATQYANIKANVQTGMGFVIGKTSGNQIMIHMPGMQFTNGKKVDYQGQRLIGFDFGLNPVAGNDELRIVSL